MCSRSPTKMPPSSSAKGAVQVRAVPQSPSLQCSNYPNPSVVAEEKIARVSGADLDLFEHSLTLEIRGTEAERSRAKKYVECVMAQRVGPVHIEEEDGEDLTTIMVPSEAVGFVTGSQASFPLNPRLHATQGTF